MRAGKLRARITIQQRGTSQDGAGQPVISWTAFATVWANKIEQSGRQFLAAGAMQNEAKSVFTIRYFAGVIPSMRISYGGLFYDIVDVSDPDGRLREMVIACTSGTSQG